MSPPLPVCLKDNNVIIYNLHALAKLELSLPLKYTKPYENKSKINISRHSLGCLPVTEVP